MKKVLAFSIVLMLVLSSFVPTFAGKMIIDENSKYAEAVLKHEYTRESSDIFSDEEIKSYYREIYEYYGEDASSIDEATPDYVLVSITADVAYEAMATILGDYIIRQNPTEIALTFGYGIYLPREDKLYFLKDAYLEGIEGIEKVFTEAGVGELIGDTDKDGKLTVKDATLIQKFLVGLCELEDDFIQGYEGGWSALSHISDFNRDLKRDIKDATAIQKHIAGLEY